MEAQSILLAVLGVLFFPILVCTVLVLILASSGQSLGLRRLGLNILIKIFEFVSKKIKDVEFEEDDVTDRCLIDRSLDADNAQPSCQVTEPEKKTFYVGEDDDNAVGSASSNDNASSMPSSPALSSMRRHQRTGSDQSNGGGPSVASPQIIARGHYNPSEFAETVLSDIYQQRLAPPEAKLPRVKSLTTLKRDFHLSDALTFAKSGVEAIIEDQVTSSFRAEELSTWNLLTRTNQNYQFRSKRLCALWGLGFFLRYFILFPFRLILAVIGLGFLVVVTAIIGYLPSGRLKQILNRYFSLMSYRILSRCFSAIVTYHNREYMAKSSGICVANHTTPIDVVVLSCDNCYAMVGQRHGGFLGVVQRALNRATDHIWFERSQVHDRMAVSRRLQEHVEDPEKLPILIFPEGTCINNTSVMMFKKGSFEVGGRIHPVAIKYHPEFGDAFWNSSEQSMVTYLIMMMTSWAIVCDVWYLPEMVRGDDEDAISFANRVKREICRQGGLVDLDWDGMLKRQKPKAALLAQAQEEISRTFSHQLDLNEMADKNKNSTSFKQD